MNCFEEKIYLIYNRQDLPVAKWITHNLEISGFPVYTDRDPSIEYNSDDEGLKGFSLKEEDLHKYKVPILRNVALTAPYFHDGSIQNLDEAVRAMAKYELGKKLSVSEIESIVAFLHSLTGVHLYLQREVETVELAEEV